jgi:hypothetical protein
MIDIIHIIKPFIVMPFCPLRAIFDVENKTKLENKLFVRNMNYIELYTK